MHRPAPAHRRHPAVSIRSSSVAPSSSTRSSSAASSSLAGSSSSARSSSAATSSSHCIHFLCPSQLVIKRSPLQHHPRVVERQLAIQLIQLRGPSDIFQQCSFQHHILERSNQLFVEFKLFQRSLDDQFSTCCTVEQPCLELQFLELVRFRSCHQLNVEHPCLEFHLHRTFVKCHHLHNIFVERPCHDLFKQLIDSSDIVTGDHFHHNFVEPRHYLHQHFDSSDNVAGYHLHDTLVECPSHYYLFQQHFDSSDICGSDDHHLRPAPSTRLYSRHDHFHHRSGHDSQDNHPAGADHYLRPAPSTRHYSRHDYFHHRSGHDSQDDHPAGADHHRRRAPSTRHHARHDHCGSEIVSAAKGRMCSVVAILRGIEYCPTGLSPMSCAGSKEGMGIDCVATTLVSRR
ncbi:hypothetical protein B0H15DRAFT_1024351 [Mycena belliarum]|uniref:Uncharacterized protein n=1 Tax=Mycena belliarum TaxID=1033014 RepID=A0AAD6TXN2_9AGAR|nr:hypothetical protein B0H15DRAFT_1024351 [Mycena belliae]